MTTTPDKKQRRKEPKKQDRDKPRLIEIRRHIASPIRRAPGQRLWLSLNQCQQQQLKKGKDYRCVPKTNQQETYPRD